MIIQIVNNLRQKELLKLFISKLYSLWGYGNLIHRTSIDYKIYVMFFF